MRVIDKAERRRRFPVSDATWDRWETSGVAPRRVQLGRGRVGWLEEELDVFARNLPRGPLSARNTVARAVKATKVAARKAA
jgi:predicted DNA-binding transcriptional regulator AlpA